MFAAAVTGTNGKTSTVEYARQLLAQNRRRAVSVGTFGTTDETGSRPTPFVLSEPGCWATHLADLGLDYDAALVEAYSTGLSSREWDDAPLDAAVLTTLGRDHLDVHQTMARYRQAKLRLFGRGLPRGGTAILNTACPLTAEAAGVGRRRKHRIVRYGRGGDVRFERLQATAGGFDATIAAFGDVFDAHVAVPATFLADNALAAVCLAVAAGLPVEPAVIGLASLRTPRGRMDHAGRVRGAEVYVDYAHTPDAIDAVVRSARARATSRVVLVFGCGGERDKAKRPLMGHAASRADLVIVTDDNPRSEDPSAIRRAIRSACPAALDIGDRGAAIQTAVEGIGRGDVLVICGKGGETHQDINGRRRAWDDREVVRRALARRTRGARRRGTRGVVACV